MIVVTGATGNVGRELVGELVTRGADVRVLVRDLARAAVLPGQVERTLGELGDSAALASAFDGAEALFLLVPGIGVEHTAKAIAAARAAGIRRIVLLSSIYAGYDPVPAMGRWHLERELMVVQSDIPVTTLRPGGFMTNALAWAPVIRAGGVVSDPTGPGRYAPIDPADIAAVAAVALTEEGHAHRAYTLTGDESFTVAEQVAILARTLGYDIAVSEAATPEEAVHSRYPHGAPPALVAAILEGFAQMRSDTLGLRTDTVQRLLGRAPRTFTAWCTRNAAAFGRATAPDSAHRSDSVLG